MKVAVFPERVLLLEKYSQIPHRSLKLSVFLVGVLLLENSSQIPRRLKVAIMVSLNSFYLGKAWIHYKRSIIREKARDKYPPNTTRWYFHNDWYEFHKESTKDYLWWWGAAWIIGMLDAYIDAHLFDLRGYTPESHNGQAKYLTLTMSF